MATAFNFRLVSSKNDGKNTIELKNSLVVELNFNLKSVNGLHLVVFEEHSVVALISSVVFNFDLWPRS